MFTYLFSYLWMFTNEHNLWMCTTLWNLWMLLMCEAGMHSVLTARATLRSQPVHLCIREAAASSACCPEATIGTSPIS
jgi:hypothetical protein